MNTSWSHGDETLTATDRGQNQNEQSIISVRVRGQANQVQSHTKNPLVCKWNAMKSEKNTNKLASSQYFQTVRAFARGFCALFC